MKNPSTLVYLSNNIDYPERELIDLTNFMIKTDQDLKHLFKGIEFEPSDEVISQIFKIIRSRKS